MDTQTCSAIRTLLPHYAADQLNPGERAAVERHTTSCPDCPAVLREWVALGQWLAQAEAAIPRDTGAARSLAAIHVRLRQTAASGTEKYDLDALDSFERSALPTLADQSPSDRLAGQQEVQALPSLRERRPSIPTSTGTLSGPPNRTPQPQRRVRPLVAEASVAMLLVLAAGLFFLIAPQLRPHQSITNPMASATTQLTATPKPLSGSWHTVPDMPGGKVQFSKSAPRIGYFCISGHRVLVLTPSSQWLYKTEDGGMTWRPVGGITPPGGFTDCGVVIDSNDANDVFVQLMCKCSPGDLPPENQMLWRSRDGGASWRQLTMPELPLGWASIVVVGARIVGLGSDVRWLHNPGDPVVCTTDPKSTDLHQINDLYASDDGGMTWQHIGQSLINQGLSIVPGDQVGFGGFSIGLVRSLSVASVGTTLFVRTFCDVKQSSGGFPIQQTYWRSVDGGETWTKLPTPNSDLFFTPSAAGGAYGVAVNPGLNSDYALPPVLLYSRDSGASWTALPSLGSIPLPPHFRHSAPGCVNTCHTHYGTPLAIALPDGMVLAVLTVDDVINNTLVYVSNVYAIDPQSPHPAWHLFAPGYVGSGRMAIVDDWPLAATKQGLVLWALTSSLENGKPVPQRIYLAPLP